jgi:hypothetical protein
VDVEELGHFNGSFGMWVIWYEAESCKLELRHRSVNFHEPIRFALRARDNNHWAEVTRLGFDVGGCFDLLVQN